jgi:hypothetical protein
MSEGHRYAGEKVMGMQQEGAARSTGPRRAGTTRRQFIKAGAAAGALALIPAQGVFLPGAKVFAASGPRRGVRLALYDPAANRRIDDTLADDVAALFDSQTLRFAGLVVSDDPTDLARYADAFNRLKQRQAEAVGVAILPTELVTGVDPDAPLTQTSFLSGGPPMNDYINAFARKARTIADSLKTNAGIDHYVIYNEPNVAGTGMHPDRFGSLQYHAWYYSLANVAEGWAGPLHWNKDAGDTFNVDQHLRETRDFLLANANLWAGWPWNAVTFNIHFGPTPNGSQDWSVDFGTWRNTLAAYGDSARFAVLEWGEASNDVCSNIATTYNALTGGGTGDLPFPEEIYYYSYDVHTDPVNPFQWGLVEYSYPVGSEFWTKGTTHAARTCADPYIG